MRITSLNLFRSQDLAPPPSITRKTNSPNNNKYSWVTLQKVNRANNITILKLSPPPKQSAKDLPSLLHSSDYLSSFENRQSNRLSRYRAKKMKRNRTEREEMPSLELICDDRSGKSHQKMRKRLNLDIIKKYSSKNHLV